MRPQDLGIGRFFESVRDAVIVAEGHIIDKAHNESFRPRRPRGFWVSPHTYGSWFSYFRHAYRSGGWPLLALSGGVLAYILQLQTWFTTIATGVTFWAILGVSVAIMRLQERDGKPVGQGALSGRRA